MSDVPPTERPMIEPSSPFNVGDIYSLGWRVMGQRYGLLLGAAAIVIIFELFLGFVIAGIQRFNPVVGGLLNIGQSLFIAPPLIAGVMYLGVRVYRDESCSIDAIFAGFSRFGTVVGVNLLITLIMMACCIPGAVVLMSGLMLTASSAAGIALIILGFGILLGVSFFFSARLSFASVICLDPRNGYPGIIQSMSLSWHATRTVWLPLIGLWLLVSLTLFGTLLLLCIGVVVVGYPFAIAVFGATYSAVFDPLQRAADEHEVDTWGASPML